MHDTNVTNFIFSLLVVSYKKNESYCFFSKLYGDCMDTLYRIKMIKLYKSLKLWSRFGIQHVQIELSLDFTLFKGLSKVSVKLWK
jgi:hypothetical protein